MGRKFILAALVLSILGLNASIAFAHPNNSKVFVDQELTVGRSQPNPRFKVDGKTGNITTVGTITATGGVVGSVNLGTVADGNAATPGLRWTNDLDTGFYRIGANNLGLSLGNSKIVDFAVATVAITNAGTFGGGYGSTGVTISTAGVYQGNGAMTVDGAGTFGSTMAITGHTDVGGGYGSTGADIGTDGAIRTNGALTVDGASTLTGAVSCGGTLASTGAATLASLVCTAAGTFGGGYGDTGTTLSTDGNIQANGTLTVDSTSTLTGDVAIGANTVTFAAGTGNTAIGGTCDITGATTIAAHTDIGGGYGATGADIGTDGAIRTNASLTVDTTSTLTGNTTFGTGYAGTGATVTAANGNFATKGTLTVDTTSTLTGNVTVGSGYAGTGATVTAANGNIQTKGALTVDTTSTLTGNVTIGTGYAGTGVTVTAAGGAIQTKGNVTIDGTLSAAGAMTQGSAEGYVVINTYHRVLLAEVNAGHTLVTVPAGLKFRLIDVHVTPYGGAVTGLTTLDILDGATKLVTWNQANLTQSSVNTLTSTGATVLADGASFVNRGAGADITIGKTGGAFATATGVDVTLTYVLEP